MDFTFTGNPSYFEFSFDEEGIDMNSIFEQMINENKSTLKWIQTKREDKFNPEQRKMINRIKREAEIVEFKEII